MSGCEDGQNPGAACHVQAEGVSIDFVDTAYMDGLPEWQMPRKKTNAAGGLMAGLTSLKSISRVWAPYIGIPPRTCQVHLHE